jgi:hypothetical protein
MKLLIIKEGEEPVAEYNTKFMQNGNVDLSDISANECTEIVLQDVLNQLTIEQIVPFLTNVAGRLRKGGRMFINGVDLRVISRRLLKFEIDDQQFNTIFYTRNSVVSSTTVRGIVGQLGLVVDKMIINGEKYELIVTR